MYPLYVLYVIIFSVNQRPLLSVYDRPTKLSVFVTSAISIPREKGATSSRRRYSIFPEASAERMAASTAAPQAMVTSGLRLLLNSLPALKNSETSLTIEGIRWNHRPRRFHERSPCRSWSHEKPSQRGKEGQERDPCKGPRNSHE